MDIIIGMGEIGKPWFNLVSKVRKVAGFDINLENCRGNWSGEPVEILHICTPYSSNFVDIVVDYVLKYKPKMLVVHSTVKPFTIKELDEDKRLPRNLQVVYSPFRGVHLRMEFDLKRYDKFYASYQDNCSLYEELLSDMGIVGYKGKNPHTLEFSKILCDTSYYGWLIAYAMKTEEIAMKYGIDYNEMWMFAHQIHQYLDDRPPCGSPGMNKIYPDPKGIGGHCIMPNLELVKEDLSEVYDVIFKINNNCIERHRKNR